MVARMSAAICGTAFPRMSLRSSGLQDHRAIDVIARSEFSNGSPHERSDMRDGLPPDVAFAHSGYGTTGPSTSLRGANSAVVARMSAAICGTVFPGCRFAHPGYGTHRAINDIARSGFSNGGPHERSDMRDGLPRMSLRSSGLRDHKVITVIARGEFSNGSPHERSDMRDG